jgi:hypothetical protein
MSDLAVWLRVLRDIPVWVDVSDARETAFRERAG